MFRYSLLANEIENANSKYNNINSNFGRGMPKEETKIEDDTKTEEENNNEDTEEKQEVKEDNSNKQEPNFGIARVSQIDNIEAVVDIKVLAELLGIGVLLTLIGSLASMVAISRFSPLTILKERS